MCSKTQPIPPELICPLTKQIFTDPIIGPDSIVYEKEAFLKWDKISKKSYFTNRRYELVTGPIEYTFFNQILKYYSQFEQSQENNSNKKEPQDLDQIILQRLQYQQSQIQEIKKFSDDAQKYFALYKSFLMEQQRKHFELQSSHKFSFSIKTSNFQIILFKENVDGELQAQIYDQGQTLYRIFLDRIEQINAVAQQKSINYEQIRTMQLYSKEPEWLRRDYQNICKLAKKTADIIFDQNNISTLNFEQIVEFKFFGIVWYFLRQKVVTKNKIFDQDVEETTLFQFVLACFQGDIEILNRMLIEQKYQLSETELWMGFTLASAEGKLNVVEFLHQNFEFDLLLGSENDWNPLRLASQLNQVKVVKYLVEEAKMNASQRISTGESLFMSITREGNLELFKYLVETVGLKIFMDYFKTASILGHLDIIKYILSTPALNDKNQREDFIIEGFLKACYYDQQVVARYFLEEFNLDPNVTGELGLFGLILAASVGYLDIIKLLKNYGDLNPFLTINDFNGSNALFVAIQQDQIEVMKYLIEELHFSPQVRNIQNLTPLMVAIQNKNMEAIKYLIEIANVNPLQMGTLGLNALFLAIKYGNIDAVKYLCEKTRDFDNSLSKSNQTPLMYSIKEGRQDIFEYLLQRATVEEINYQDNGQLTVLMYAIKHKNQTAIEMLVSNLNTDLTIKNDKNMDALQLAKTQINQNIYYYLKEAVKDRIGVSDVNEK